MNRIEEFVRLATTEGHDLEERVAVSVSRMPTLTLGAAAAAFAGGAAIACALAEAYCAGEG